MGKVKLGAKSGEIEGFITGRPFPEEPSMDDPRAGEKYFIEHAPPVVSTWLPRTGTVGD